MARTFGRNWHCCEDSSLLRRYILLTGQIVSNVSTDLIVRPSSSRSEKFSSWLTAAEDGGIAIVRNIGSCQFSRRNNPEDLNHQHHRCENLICRISVVCCSVTPCSCVRRTC